MINARINLPGLSDLKEKLRAEHNDALFDNKKLKARIIPGHDEELKREERVRINRVFNSISQTILRSV